jgi:hypothetical protein
MPPELIAAIIGAIATILSACIAYLAARHTQKPLRIANEQNREDIQTIAQLARAILTKDQLGILQKLSKDESITTDTTNKIYYEGFKQDILGLRVEGSLRI